MNAPEIRAAALRVLKRAGAAVADRLPRPKPARVIPREKRLVSGLILAAAVVLAAAGWLSWRLPVGRALQPLPDPTVVLMAEDGTPIGGTLRGSRVK